MRGGSGKLEMGCVGGRERSKMLSGFIEDWWVKKGAGRGIMISVLVGCETRAVGKSTKTHWTTTR